MFTDMEQTTDQSQSNTDQVQTQTSDLTSLLQKRVDDSQSFIETLKQEKQELADKLTALESQQQQVTNVDELLNEVRSHKEQLNTVQNMELPDPATITDTVLKKLVEKENTDKVTSALKSTYGEEYNKIAVDKAKSLGLSIDDLNNMSARSPEAILTMLNAKATPTPAMTTGTTQSDTNTSDQTINNLMSLRTTSPKEFRKEGTQRAIREAIIQKAKAEGRIGDK